MQEDTPMAAEGRTMTWSETWLKALTQPAVAAYEEIASDPGGSSNKAFIWVAISSAIGMIITFLGNSLFSSSTDGSGSILFTLMCGVVLGPIISVIVFAVMTGITQAIASALGGTGTFSKLAYVWAAYAAPLSLVSTGLSIFPYVGFLTIPLGFYAIVLNVIANKAVNQFSWTKAIVSSVALLALIFILVAIFVIVILALLGPVINEVFSEIMSEIQ